MKNFIAVTVLIFSLFSIIPLAGAADDASVVKSPKDQQATAPSSDEPGIRKEYLAEQKVRMLPSKHGDTIDSYMNNMVRIPMAQDLGWKVFPMEDGYEVERSILINNAKTFQYKWKVSNSGEVTPLNDKARSLMK